MSPYSEILVAQGATGRCLLDFALWFGQVFDVQGLIEHDSSNYPEGWYFKGSWPGMSVSVSVVDHDDVGVEKYRFEVVVESRLAEEQWAAAAEHTRALAKSLAAQGYACMVVAQGLHSGAVPPEGVAYDA